MKQEKIPQNQVSFFLLDQGKSPVWSFSKNNDSVAGIIFNLSPFGGKLLLPKDYIVSGETIKLTITQDSGLDKLVIKAKILWKKNSPGSNYEEIGCQFVDSSNQLTLNLMQLIRVSWTSNENLYFRCQIQLM